MPAWSRQKERIANNLIPSYPEVVQQINSISYLRDRAFLALMYVTGSRVSEAVMAEKKDFLDTSVDGEPILAVTTKTKKIRSKLRDKFRTMPIVKKEEPELIEILNSWIQNKDGELWGFKSKRRGQQICDKWLHINAHFLRHTRITHLGIHFGYDPIAIRQMMNWRDTMMYEQKYLHTTWRNILHMRRR